MARANNKDNVLIRLGDEVIEMRIDKGQARASAPMAQKAGLDVVEGEVSFEKDIFL